MPKLFGCIGLKRVVPHATRHDVPFPVGFETGISVDFRSKGRFFGAKMQLQISKTLGFLVVVGVFHVVVFFRLLVRFYGTCRHLRNIFNYIITF